VSLQNGFSTAALNFCFQIGAQPQKNSRQGSVLKDGDGSTT